MEPATARTYRFMISPHTRCGAGRPALGLYRISPCPALPVRAAERLPSPGSSVFERHHEAKSHGTITFCRKRRARPHGRLEARGAAQADG